MEAITVHLKNDSDHTFVFEVHVQQSAHITQHIVTLNINDYERITEKKITKKDFVKLCFTFLLERETNDSILRTFDIMDIKKYFPEFEKEIHKRVLAHE